MTEKLWVGEKLWVAAHMRLTENMIKAIQVLAELDDRSIQHETRHLIRIGLEQERERIRRLPWPQSRWIAVRRFFQFFGESWEGRR